MNAHRQLALDVLSDDAHQQFRRIIAAIPPGRRVTVNHLRDLLDAAGIPETSRGGLFDGACKAGLLRPVRVKIGDEWADVYVPSTGESARRARVRLYERPAA
jgi:hypothetical protein